MQDPYVDSPIECGLAGICGPWSWGAAPRTATFDLHAYRLTLRIGVPHGRPPAGVVRTEDAAADPGLRGRTETKVPPPVETPIADGATSEPVSEAEAQPTDEAEAQPTDQAEPEPTDRAEPQPTDQAEPEPRDQAGCQPAGSGPLDAVDRVRGLARQRSALEAQLLGAARDLAAEVGGALLTDKGFADVEELTSAQRRRWRAETKRLACAELQVALGLGVKEARQMIGVACAPVPVRAVVGEALESGLASWGHVRAFWDRCGSLAADEAAVVCESLFGSDAATVVAERLGPDGTVLDRPWHQAEFWAALEREAVRVEGQDVVAERERRRRARADRRVWMRVDDDSTATLAITGPLTSLCAISQRLDVCAKALRKGGDERTLAQLRSDVAQTLLLHGHLELPDPQDALITPTDGETVAQIVTAQPSVCLEVVVPWDALAGRSVCATCRTGVVPTDTQLDGESDRTPPQVGPPAPAQEPAPPPGPDQAPRPAPPPPSGRAAADQALPPPAPTPARPSSAVGEILGRHPAYLTSGHARELALAPGTTLARLLVDPADGRLIERSVTSYRPDAAMRRQVLAADVYSRAPGSRSPALACEIDHEQPWGSAGATSETNLVLKDVRSHQFKTEGWWTSALGPRRDVRWETLLGQVEQTRGHDYRQYLPSRRPTADATRPDGPGDTSKASVRRSPAGPEGARSADADVTTTQDDDLDLACRALYAALAHRGVAALLADTDDADGATDHDPRLSGWITLAHRGPDGRRRGGPPEDCATVASLLGMTTGHPRDDEATTPGPHEDQRDQRPGGPVQRGPHDRSTDPQQQPWEASGDDPPPF